jgi:hypothetical protein
LGDRDKDKDNLVIDSEPVQLTYHGGVTKSRVPKRWLRRPDLKTFFAGDLEIRLILDTETNEPHLEIRRVLNNNNSEQ